MRNRGVGRNVQKLQCRALLSGSLHKIYVMRPGHYINTKPANYIQFISIEGAQDFPDLKAVSRFLGLKYADRGSRNGPLSKSEDV